MLSRLWVGRKARRVFISDRRDDASDLACQLHHELQRRGFAVFLDECSIEHGDDFQRELKYWRNDADLLVLLASPDFHRSDWVREEVEFALAHGIGVVAAVWNKLEDSKQRPDGVRDLLDRIPPDRQHVLAPFSSKLEAPDLAELLLVIHRERAGALRSRLGCLLDPARQRVTVESGEAPDEPLPGLLVTDDLAVQVLPYRPTAESLHTLAVRGTPKRVACDYEENDPSHDTISALRWAIEGTRPSLPNRVELRERSSP